MATIVCAECGQSASVILTGDMAEYSFAWERCAQRFRPSTPQERLVDSSKCPRLEASIEAAQKRGEI